MIELSKEMNLVSVKSLKPYLEKIELNTKWLICSSELIYTILSTIKAEIVLNNATRLEIFLLLNISSCDLLLID